MIAGTYAQAILNARTGRGTMETAGSKPVVSVQQRRFKELTVDIFLGVSIRLHHFHSLR
jgi:hypothetical protein